MGLLRRAHGPVVRLSWHGGVGMGYCVRSDTVYSDVFAIRAIGSIWECLAGLPSPLLSHISVWDRRLGPLNSSFISMLDKMSDQQYTYLKGTLLAPQ